MSNLITGLFDTVSSAENAVDLLKQRSYGENEISIIMRNRDDAQEFAEHTGSSTMSGIGAGAAIGGTLGAVLGGLLAVGTIALPGIGLLVGGTAAAMLAGAGAGGLAGSLVGWLVNLGIDDEVAPYYERTLNEGGIVVAVSAHPDDDANVRQILEGQSVAVAGRGLPTYLEPGYASRYNDLTTPATSIGYAPLRNETNPVNPSANPMGAIPTPGHNEANAANNSPETRVNVNPLLHSEQSVPKVYDDVNHDAETTMHRTTDETEHTVNSANAESRSDSRTADTRERNAEREANDTGTLDSLKTAVVNTFDNTKTAVENQTDKMATGVQHTTDRVGSV